MLAEMPRVKIDTPSLAGSINLVGARLDDLVLKRYRETTDDNSPNIELLSPDGVENSYFVDFSSSITGWK